VFRRPPPAAPDPSLSADRHVTDTGGQQTGNSVLAGLPVYLVRRLHSVLNAAARFTCGDPTTSPTRWPASNHWLTRPWENRFQDRRIDKSSTDLRRGTSAHLRVSPTYPVDDRCVLSTPIAW